MWVDKYKPQKDSDFVGLNYHIKNIRNWISNPKKVNVPFLFGPPGLGKTSCIHHISKSMNLDLIEVNASDSRSIKSICDITGITEGSTMISASLFSSKTPKNTPKKRRMYVFDEADGLTSAAIGILINLINQTIQHTPKRVFVIVISNENFYNTFKKLKYGSKKYKQLDSLMGKLQFKKPRSNDVYLKLKFICNKENIKNIPSYSQFSDVFESLNCDIRSTINNYQFLLKTPQKKPQKETKKIHLKRPIFYDFETPKKNPKEKLIDSSIIIPSIKQVSEEETILKQSSPKFYFEKTPKEREDETPNPPPKNQNYVDNFQAFRNVIFKRKTREFVTPQNQDQFILFLFENYPNLISIGNVNHSTIDNLSLCDSTYTKLLKGTKNWSYYPFINDLCFDLNSFQMKSIDPIFGRGYKKIKPPTFFQRMRKTSLEFWSGSFDLDYMTLSFESNTFSTLDFLSLIHGENEDERIKNFRNLFNLYKKYSSNIRKKQPPKTLPKRVLNGVEVHFNRSKFKRIKKKNKKPSKKKKKKSKTKPPKGKKRKRKRKKEREKEPPKTGKRKKKRKIGKVKKDTQKKKGNNTLFNYFKKKK